MKQEWIIHRRMVQQVDGQRRWDLTYQCLLRWAKAARQETSTIERKQEAHDESGYLCSSIDPAAGADPDY